MKSQTKLPLLMKGVALESIDFQDDTLFKEITAQFEALKGMDQSAMAASKAVLTIEKIIKDATNLDVEFTMDNSDAYSLVPTLDKNNPLIHNITREFITNAPALKMIEKAGGVVRGSIDLMHSKVTGVFSELKCVINFPAHWVSAKFFTTGFTAAECAAITLHEVGHLFTFFSFILRSVTTNQVLSAVAKGLDQSADQSEREIVLISAAKQLNLSEAEMKEIVLNGNTKVAGVLVLQDVTKSRASEVGSNIYDMNNWEQLADNFAARHGAARDLVTGLNKLDRLIGDISTRSTARYLGLEAVKLLTLFATMGLGATFGAVGLIPAAIPFFTMFALVLADSPGGPNYDRPGVRLKRIRDQLVEHLKDRDLPKEKIQALTEDLDAIDSLLKTVNTHFQFFDVVFNFLSGARRDRFNQEKLQQELETLAANSLFVKAAELKTLA